MPTLIFTLLPPFYHPSTTLLPSRDFPIQALLFPNSTSISFFIPPINTVFYLIERLIQYFILFNDCDKERKRRACVEAIINLLSMIFRQNQDCCTNLITMQLETYGRSKQRSKVNQLLIFNLYLECILSPEVRQWQSLCFTCVKLSLPSRPWVYTPPLASSCS